MWRRGVGRVRGDPRFPSWVVRQITVHRRRGSGREAEFRFEEHGVTADHPGDSGKKGLEHQPHGGALNPAASFIFVLPFHLLLCGS